MVLDRPDVDLDDEDGVDELNLDLDGKRRGLHRLHISQLLEMVLQDAQTRLFFKAQSVIQTDIRYYVTKPEDLAYPDILLGKAFASRHTSTDLYCRGEKAGVGS